MYCSSTKFRITDFAFLVAGLHFHRQRLLPTIAAGQVAAVPLGPDVVDFAEQAPLDHVDGVVVEHAVMPLVADGEVQIVLVGHAGHQLALGHVVGHQFFGQHVLAGLEGIDGDRGMQMQRQGDDDRLDIGVFQHLFVVAVDLDVLLRFFAVLMTEDGVKARASRSGGLAFVVPFKRPMDVERANVADRHAVDILGIHRPDQDAPFVARTNQRYAKRLGESAAAVAVAKVGRAEASPADDAEADDVLEELAAVGIIGFIGRRRIRGS